MKLKFTLLSARVMLQLANIPSSDIQTVKLLVVNLTKPNDLLSMLNQIKNDIQFTMEKSQRKLPF